MIQHYTENNIVRFIFKECDLFEKLEMEFAMEDDSTLLESFNELKEGYNTLPKVMFSPSKPCLDYILAYSSSEV
jgi:hypothetical protein